MLLARVPTPPLSDYVNLLWYAAAWKPPHARERHMPDGSVNIVISLREGGTTRPSAGIVSGPRSQSVIIGTASPSTVIGVHFKRGAAAPFLDAPVSDLTNISAPLPDVCGPQAASLRERLLEEDGPDRRLDLLERWLVARLIGRCRLPDPAILWAVRQLEGRPHMQVRSVSAHIGRSSRWFINRFASDVGLTPKLFSRVQRFHRALRQMHRGAAMDLATLALSNGYFDQAHLTHDFRDIAGMTPTQYMSGRTEHLNHVAIHD